MDLVILCPTKLKRKELGLGFCIVSAFVNNAHFTKGIGIVIVLLTITLVVFDCIAF